MRQGLRKLFHALLSGGLCCGTAAAVTTETGVTQEWRFRVFLNDAEIGYHHFVLSESDRGTEMRTEADFKVRFLRIPVFRYSHSNTERWADECVRAIESETRVNGSDYSVEGSMLDEDLVISATADDAEARSTLPGCVMTFAYWDPQFLGQERLLNTQTGEYVAVDAELVGNDVINVRGERVSAYRYRLTAEDLAIDLWYSSDREWLRLESAVGAGRRLRYELT